MQDDQDEQTAMTGSTKPVSGGRRRAARRQTATQASLKKSAVGCPVPAAKRSRPVQLTIFDYAASIGVTLLPEVS